MADTQTERAYQKQPTIFQNKKRVLLGEGGKEKLPRYYRNVGLGFKTPKEVRGFGLRTGALVVLMWGRRFGTGSVVALAVLLGLEASGGFSSPACPSVLWGHSDLCVPPDTRLSLQAIEGTYIDKKCPFTGNVSIRGRILSGVVTKMKMQRTIVIRRDYLHYIRKYNRFEKRHKNMSVHLSPCFRDVQIGDIVTVGECRPLSKTVRFNVLKVTKAAGTKKQFQKF
uniref:Small ribosomal subunit protein uS17 n=1 Tax=Taeniopygia guttata TaxID=59729 RepID=A0A674H038_TAEGU